MGIQRAIEDLLLGLARLKGLTCYALRIDQSEWSVLEWKLGRVQVISQTEQLVVCTWYGQEEVLHRLIPVDPAETLRVRLGAVLHDAFVAVAHRY